MTYDPLKRDSTWTMIEPGCYIDPAGRGHIFPDEVVAQLQIDHPEAGFDFSREDYDLVVESCMAMMRARAPEMNIQFVRHERDAS